MKFFIGTTNPHKIREIGGILSATGCQYEVTDPIDPDETEDDFEGNALLKVRAYAKHSGDITISEDSGLIIQALGGLPGPWSARFSECTLDCETMRITSHTPSTLGRTEVDTKNNQQVIELMRDVSQPYRAASFKVILAVAEPSGEILFKGVGESHGWIAEEMRGENGFGYDPVFIGSDTFGKTYAELDAMRKNLRSHRKKVLDEFKAWLGQYLKRLES